MEKIVGGEKMLFTNIFLLFLHFQAAFFFRGIKSCHSVVNGKCYMYKMVKGPIRSMISLCLFYVEWYTVNKGILEERYSTW